MAKDKPEETVEQQLAACKAELETALQINNDLQKQLEEAEAKLAKTGNKPAEKPVKPTVPTETFKDAAKDEYAFTIPAFTNPLNNHKSITAAEALRDKDLMQHLVDIGFGGLKNTKTGKAPEAKEEAPAEKKK